MKSSSESLVIGTSREIPFTQFVALLMCGLALFSVLNGV